MYNLAEDFKVESGGVPLLRSLLHLFYYLLQIFNLSEVEFNIISEKFNLCRTKIISV